MAKEKFDRTTEPGNEPKNKISKALKWSFFELGADVNGNDGDTILKAAWVGNFISVKYLVEKGADVNAKSSGSGNSPLYDAVIYNHMDNKEYLSNHKELLVRKTVDKSYGFPWGK